jgi:hypothetical protein
MTHPDNISRVVSFLLAASLVAAAGCEEERRSEGRGRGRGGGKAAKADTSEVEGAEEKEEVPLVFKDEDFIESIRNRDPFVNYGAQVTATEAVVDITQRPVIMPTTSVESMHLIAIITGLPRPKAMLVDPGGVGHVVQRGDYIGRPKVMQAAGSVSMTLNWRVDRIRDNEVVLTQQDPSDPNRTALTKIIMLNEEVAQR